MKTTYVTRSHCLVKVFLLVGPSLPLEDRDRVTQHVSMQGHTSFYNPLLQLCKLAN